MNGPKFLSYERKKFGVLVIEAETQILVLLQIALQPQGYDVKLASNFIEGLELFRLHRDDFAAILIGGSILDSDANHVISAFLTLKPQIVLVVMTGDILKHDPKELMDWGVLEVVKKPFILNELFLILEKALKNTQSTKHEISPEPASDEEGKQMP